MGLSYKETGVDIKKGEKAVDQIKELVKSTYNSNVITDLGGFGGVFNLDLEDYNNPQLVASTDGVGTKLKLAFKSNKHDTIGIDLVAMCVNDLITLGAKPLFFLDYLATGSLDLDQFQDIITGVVTGCKQAGCALLGGETAEMPGFYNKGEYDTAGFSVGIVDKDTLIDGSTIKSGDTLIGLASNGIHSNGYSLIRKIYFDKDTKINENLMNKLIRPTKIYVKTILKVINKFKIKGIAHITGGGLLENVPRILPKNLSAGIELDKLKTPDIFNDIQKRGKIKKEEMFRTFNMGIGMVLVVNSKQGHDILNLLDDLGQESFLIGNIINGDNKVILKG